MNGIELTQESGKCIWVPTASVVSVSPYMGFDGKETGTQLVLTKTTIRVMEEYTKVVEELQT